MSFGQLKFTWAGRPIGNCSFTRPPLRMKRNTMRIPHLKLYSAILSMVAVSLLGCPSSSGDGDGDVQDGTSPEAETGTEEFGMSKVELREAIEKVEGLIAQCMRENGFQYVAVDYATVRAGMMADKTLPAMDEDEFIEEYGYGIATLYTGESPQINEGYSPARVGLGEVNVANFKALSPEDQAAYNRALFGEDSRVSFAVGLETEDFSRCGGCTLAAIEQVFKPEQLQATYYNPNDARINNDPRMKKALQEFAEKAREEGYDYNHPDEAEVDIRERLNAITEGGMIPLASLPPEKQKALSDLQDYERKVAVTILEMEEEIFEPVEEEIERELHARPIE